MKFTPAPLLISPAACSSVETGNNYPLRANRIRRSLLCKSSNRWSRGGFNYSGDGTRGLQNTGYDFTTTGGRHETLTGEVSAAKGATEAARLSGRMLTQYGTRNALRLCEYLSGSVAGFDSRSGLCGRLLVRTKQKSHFNSIFPAGRPIF